MPSINNLPAQSPLGRFVNQVREAHSPAPKRQAAKALEDDIVNLTMGASGGVLSYTGLALAQGTFNAQSMSSFALPALSGAAAGALVGQLSDNAAVKVTAGVLTGAAMGFALQRLGLASSQAVLTGAISGAGGSAATLLLQR